MLELFFVFLRVGMVSFGGAYSILSTMYTELVDKRGLLLSEEFWDLMAISEMTPGPISINMATFIGYRVMGIGGAIITTLGVVTPSLIIVVILGILYKKYRNLGRVNWALMGIRPAVIGIVAIALVRIVPVSFIDIKSGIIAVISFALLKLAKLNAIAILGIAAVLGMVLY